MSIIIYTSEYDPHADAAVLALREAGTNPIRINSDRLIDTVEFEYNPADGTGVLSIKENGRSTPIEDIESVWLRRPVPVSASDRLSPMEHLFLHGEMTACIDALLDQPNVRWLNHPVTGRRASSKSLQIKVARANGFSVPETLIANRSSRIRGFYERHRQRIVYKSMEGAQTALGRWPVLAGLLEANGEQLPAVGTVVIHPDNIELIDSADGQPGLFQEVIDRQCEIRATVFGDEVHAARLDAPVTADSVDIRDFIDVVDYSMIRLPDEVNTRCVKLTRALGLEYAAIDILLNKNGEYIFLEANPFGNFLYYQELFPDSGFMKSLIRSLRWNHKP